MTGSLLSACGAHVLTIAVMHWTSCELPKQRIESADCRFHDRIQILATIRTLPNLRVSAANFGIIRQGMTADEVEERLGFPTKVISEASTGKKAPWKNVPTPEGNRCFRAMKTGIWIGMEQVVAVDFGEKGTVEWSELEPLEEWAGVNLVDTRGVLVRLRDWLIAKPDE